MLWFCILITRPFVDVSRIRERHLEIKRMFVLPEVRGRVCPKYFADLEQWGVESGVFFSGISRRKLLVCIRNVDIQ
jgi:hypothetical protein